VSITASLQRLSSRCALHYLPDPRCFPPSTRSHAITLILFIRPTFTRYRVGVPRPAHASLVCTGRRVISSALGPFGAIPIFARSSARTSINSRERKRGRERESSALHGYLFPSPLAHFNIPPINRPASSNQGVSHYPRLNFLQNGPFFSARLRPCRIFERASAPRP
jgi:hypothetical protein